jgi:hypothetical protein
MAKITKTAGSLGGVQVLRPDSWVNERSAINAGGRPPDGGLRMETVKVSEEALTQRRQGAKTIF